MELKFVFAALVLVLPIFARSETVVYDITDKKYGAKPDADIAKIVTNIWKEAIASSSPSKIVIPQGTWKVSQLILEGENKAPIELEVRGTVLADPNVNNLPDKDREWITINHVTNFILSGGGVFDGQGSEAWKSNDCHKGKGCGKLPYNLSFNSHNNSYIHDVTTKDSKNFHVNLMSSYNVTFQRFTISAPDESPNTDGIHIARGNNIVEYPTSVEISVLGRLISMGNPLTYNLGFKY